MAKKKTEAKVQQVPGGDREKTSSEVFRDRFKLKPNRHSRKVNDFAELLWFGRDPDEEKMTLGILRALEFYESLDPADGAEGMLATQMVGTHFAALECLRRAAIPGQTFEGRDMALKHAHKLMMLYGKQLEALNKHRGKGQQKVTVEHVNVAAGGQAIVGNVEAGARRADRAVPPVEHKPEPVLQDIPMAEKQKRTRSRE